MEIPVQSGQGYGHIYLNIIFLPGLGPQQPYGKAGDEQASDGWPALPGHLHRTSSHITYLTLSPTDILLPVLMS